MSKKSDILTKLASVLNEMVITDDIKTVNYQIIKQVFSDFSDFELPAIQLIDQGEVVEHEQGRAKKTWDMVIEIVNKTTTSGEINQQSLFDLQNKVELKLWERPNLGIKGVIDLKYLGSSTDLHMVLPFYYVRMDFQVRYYDSLVGQC